MRTNKGFTLIELLVVISIIALLIGILLPALGAARATARRMQSNTQIRGIHQAMVVFAQSNRSNFPGLDGSGKVVPATTGSGGDATNGTGDFRSGVIGTDPARRIAILLNGNFFTPEYVISPVDTSKEEWAGDDAVPTTLTNHYSYAMLNIHYADAAAPTEPESFRRREWSETLNTEAAVMSDRAIQDTGDAISSVHTRADSGDWRGGVARNDNSVAFETTHDQLNTRYANGEATHFDNIFDAGTTHTDATGPGHGLMTYGGENTIFSAD